MLWNLQANSTDTSINISYRATLNRCQIFGKYTKLSPMSREFVVSSHFATPKVAKTRTNFCN